MLDMITAQKSKGEVLVYQRGAIPADMESRKDDIETGFDSEKSGSASRGGKEGVNIQKQTSIVSWKDVTYDIKIKGEERRILDNVDGWVKPGTLTALMVGHRDPQSEDIVADDRVYQEQGRLHYWTSSLPV
jgi:ATP-binding cassette subfamily G (WHITE) protein 2 (PDR)